VVRPEVLATPPNRRARLAAHLRRRTTLISARPDRQNARRVSGCIDRLVRKALAGELENRVEVVYISPLQGAGQRHPEKPGMPSGRNLQLGGERGLLMPEIRSRYAPADSLPQERRAMLKRPPHILVTTAESLYILLTAEKSRGILQRC